MGVNPLLLRKVAFGHRTEHLLGRLGGRKVFLVAGVLSFEELHPAGAAGSKHGPAVLAPVGEPLHELAAFLHDGQVGGEIGIEYIVEADTLQGCHHAASGPQPRVQAELLRPGHPNRRSHLDHRSDLGVCQGPQHLVGVIPDRQSASGAVGNTLTTEHAVGVLQQAVVADVHRGAGAGARHIPDVHTLNFVAHLDAAHTLDALAGLPDDGNAQIHPGALRLHVIGLVMDVQVMRQLLQCAVSAADADGAVGVVLAEDQPQIGLSGLPYSGGVGLDDHALQHLGVAGGD